MRIIKQDQRGATLPIIIVLIVIVVAAGLFWFLTQNKEADKVTQLNPNLNKQEAKAQLTACTKAGGDEPICTFATSSNGLDGAYTMEVSTDGDITKISQDGKGNSMIESTGTNVINLDGDMYMKNEGVWYKYPGSDTEDTLPIDLDSFSSNFDVDESAPENSLRDTFKSLGKEDCGNLQCFKYQIFDLAENDGALTFIWFDDKDYKLRKVETADTDGSVYTMTFTYGNVNITAPSPVQEMNF